MLRVRARLSSSVQAIPVLGQVLILLVGGVLTLQGRISVGVFLAFLSYLASLAGPARMLGTMIAMMPRVRASAERIFEILRLRPDVVDPSRPATPSRPAGIVEFDRVSFSYPGGGPVLRGLSFTVSPGERVAVVGSSGAGKSTAMDLLLRFWDPTSGRVLLDGEDVRQLTTEDLRRRIGVALQDTFLFDGTIRENIAYGSPDASDTEIEAVAGTAGVDFISSLPDGFDTMVGSEGLSLSGGQRQRVALARALLMGPEVLVLDDVTASVDAETERTIVRGLDRILGQRTTIMVAYRESTIRLCDRVVLVEHGRVVAQGTHEDLIETSSLYRDLMVASERGERGAAPSPAAEADPWARRPPARSLHIGQAPTPELERLIERLPPMVDRPQVDLVAESNRDERFAFSRFLGPHWRPLLVCLAIVTLDAICTLSGPLFVRAGETAIRNGSVAVLGMVCAGFLAVSLFDWWDMAAENLWTARTGERVLLALRARIYGQIHRLGLDFYDRVAVGRIITRMTSDVDAMSNFLQTGLISGAIAIMTFAGMATVVFVLNWKLALLILVAVPPTAAVGVWYRRVAGPAYDRARQLISLLNARQHEALAGIRVTQAFRREDVNLGRFRDVSRRQYRESTRGQMATTFYASLIDLESLSLTAVVLGVGGALVMSRQLNLATLVAFLLYLASVFSPIQQLVQVLNTYQRARAGAARIRELLDRRSSTPVTPDAADPGRVCGAIELRDASLRYSATREYALRDVGLAIRPGERIALVGRTGAGKSSVAKLVARFYDPTSGEVLVDGTDLRELDLHAYHGRLGYVPQEPFLFSRSIRDNIAYARPDASDEEVEAAARAVGAHEFIARLPYGYHHVLAERGRSLSAGERQLICLARAMVARPRILILDEPTANLDMAGERRVSRAMDVASRGRTTVLVSHRPAAHGWVERIVRVAAGRIVGESGPEESGDSAVAS
jgi:ATP-binding cassette subfamily B protein